MFNRKKYETKLKHQERKNPGKANRALRKARQNAERGQRIPSSRIVEDKRRREAERRTKYESRDY